MKFYLNADMQVSTMIFAPLVKFRLPLELKGTSVIQWKGG